LKVDTGEGCAVSVVRSAGREVGAVGHTIDKLVAVDDIAGESQIARKADHGRQEGGSG